MVGYMAHIFVKVQGWRSLEPCWHVLVSACAERPTREAVPRPAARTGSEGTGTHAGSQPTQGRDEQASRGDGSHVGGTAGQFFVLSPFVSYYLRVCVG